MIYERGTNVSFLERASKSALPFSIDDPPKSTSKGSDMSELVVDLYSASVISSSKNVYVPKSGAIVATNFCLSTEEGMHFLYEYNNSHNMNLLIIVLLKWDICLQFEKLVWLHLKSFLPSCHVIIDYAH